MAIVLVSQLTTLFIKEFAIKNKSILEKDLWQWEKKVYSLPWGLVSLHISVSPISSFNILIASLSLVLNGHLDLLLSRMGSITSLKSPANVTCPSISPKTVFIPWKKCGSPLLGTQMLHSITFTPSINAFTHTIHLSASLTSFNNTNCIFFLTRIITPRAFDNKLWKICPTHPILNLTSSPSFRWVSCMKMISAWLVFKYANILCHLAGFLINIPGHIFNTLPCHLYLHVLLYPCLLYY